MKGRLSRAAMAALLLCAVLSAFYLRAFSARRVSEIPVERVFARVKPTEALMSYRERRDAERASEIAALSALAPEDAAASDALRALIERAENERAVEGALAAMGQERAVCVLRRDSAALYIPGTLTAAQAQAIVALCGGIAGTEPENVFILDECAYL